MPQPLLSTFHIHQTLYIHHLINTTPSKADLMIPIIHMKRHFNQAEPQYFCSLNGQKWEQTSMSKLSAILPSMLWKESSFVLWEII